ncbi:MAG: twin-arginine translocase subunit TatC [Bacteroidetes bacterium]|nr:twin-arginine translocase subunit TatC [Bacteroidota bacterium]MBS1684604.1 twin-arginine translocase subunit TatC [Bacteroidota bacterium]
MALFGKNNNVNDGAEMGFFDHIDALRQHIFRAAICVILITIVMLYKSSWVFDQLIFGPVKSDFLTYRALCHLSNSIRPLLCKFSPLLCPDKGLCFDGLDIKFMNTELFGQFMTQIQISIVLGVVFSFPYIIWEIWRFIRPALSENEARKSGRIVVFSSIFFFVGVAFAYFLIVPFSLNFAYGYQISGQVSNMFTLDNYISFVTMMMLGSGAIFELPMIIFFLAKMGIITAQFMRQYRRHAIVVILILAAVITPSPDMFTMTIVAIPIYFLFELSIVVAARVNPGQKEMV